MHLDEKAGLAILTAFYTRNYKETVALMSHAIECNKRVCKLIHERQFHYFARKSGGQVL